MKKYILGFVFGLLTQQIYAVDLISMDRLSSVFREGGDSVMAMPLRGERDLYDVALDDSLKALDKPFVLYDQENITVVGQVSLETDSNGKPYLYVNAGNSDISINSIPSDMRTVIQSKGQVIYGGTQLKGDLELISESVKLLSDITGDGHLKIYANFLSTRSVKAKSVAFSVGESGRYINTGSIEGEDVYMLGKGINRGKILSTGVLHLDGFWENDVGGILSSLGFVHSSGTSFINRGRLLATTGYEIASKIYEEVGQVLTGSLGRVRSDKSIFGDGHTFLGEHLLVNSEELELDIGDKGRIDFKGRMHIDTKQVIGDIKKEGEGDFESVPIYGQILQDPSLDLLRSLMPFLGVDFESTPSLESIVKKAIKDTQAHFAEIPLGFSFASYSAREILNGLNIGLKKGPIRFDVDTMIFEGIWSHGVDPDDLTSISGSELRVCSSSLGERVIIEAPTKVFDPDRKDDDITAAVPSFKFDELVLKGGHTDILVSLLGKNITFLDHISVDIKHNVEATKNIHAVGVPVLNLIDGALISPLMCLEDTESLTLSKSELVGNKLIFNNAKKKINIFGQEKSSSGIFLNGDKDNLFYILGDSYISGDLSISVPTFQITGGSSIGIFRGVSVDTGDLLWASRDEVTSTATIETGTAGIESRDVYILGDTKVLDKAFVQAKNKLFIDQFAAYQASIESKESASLRKIDVDTLVVKADERLVLSDVKTKEGIFISGGSFHGSVLSGDKISIVARGDATVTDSRSSTLGISAGAGAAYASNLTGTNIHISAPQASVIARDVRSEETTLEGRTVMATGIGGGVAVARGEHVSIDGEDLKKAHVEASSSASLRGNIGEAEVQAANYAYLEHLKAKVAKVSTPGMLATRDTDVDQMEVAAKLWSNSGQSTFGIVSGSMLNGGDMHISEDSYLEVGGRLYNRGQIDAEKALHLKLADEFGLRNIRVGGELLLDLDYLGDLQWLLNNSSITSGERLMVEIPGKYSFTRGLHTAKKFGLIADGIDIGGDVSSDGGILLEARLFDILNHNRTITSPETLLQAKRDIIARGGRIQGNYLQVIAGRNVEQHHVGGTPSIFEGGEGRDYTRNGIVYDEKGKPMKDAEGSYITQDYARRLAINLQAGGQYINDGSIVRSAGDNSIQAREGIIMTPHVWHEVQESVRESGGWFRKKVTVTHTVIPHVMKVSILGVGNFLVSEEGGIDITGADIIAASGTEVIAKKTVNIKDIITTITQHVSTRKSFGFGPITFGASRSTYDARHDVSTPSIVLDGARIYVRSLDDAIKLKGVILDTPGIAHLEAKKDIEVTISKLRHEIHETTKGWGIGCFATKLADVARGEASIASLVGMDGFISSMKNLMHAEDGQEALFHGVGAGIQSFGLLASYANADGMGDFLGKQAGLFNGDGKFRPTFDFTAYETRQRTEYETPGMGSMHAGSLYAHSHEGNVMFLEGVPVMVDRDATIRARDFIQRGFESRFRQSESARSVTVSTNFSDSLSVGVAGSNSSMWGSSWMNEFFNVGRNLELDLTNRWLMEAANTRAGSIIGTVLLMEIISRLDTMEGRSSNFGGSVGFSGSGPSSFSINGGRGYSSSQRVGTRSGLFVAEGINHDPALPFNVGTIDLTSGAVLSDGAIHTDAAIRSKELSEHSRSSSTQAGVSMGGALGSAQYVGQKASKRGTVHSTIAGAGGTHLTGHMEGPLSTDHGGAERTVHSDKKSKVMVNIPIPTSQTAKAWDSIHHRFASENPVQGNSYGRGSAARAERREEAEEGPTVGTSGMDDAEEETAEERRRVVRAKSGPKDRREEARRAFIAAANRSESAEDVALNNFLNPTYGMFEERDPAEVLLRTPRRREAREETRNEFMTRKIIEERSQGGNYGGSFDRWYEDTENEWNYAHPYAAMRQDAYEAAYATVMGLSLGLAPTATILSNGAQIIAGCNGYSEAEAEIIGLVAGTVSPVGVFKSLRSIASSSSPFVSKSAKALSELSGWAAGSAFNDGLGYGLEKGIKYTGESMGVDSDTSSLAGKGLQLIWGLTAGKRLHDAVVLRTEQRAMRGFSWMGSRVREATVATWLDSASPLPGVSPLLNPAVHHPAL